MRSSEVRAQREFTEAVLAHGGFPFAWSDGGEPPDLWLTVNGRLIAVEVTEVMHSVALRARSMASRGVVAVLKQAGDELEAEAQSRGLLNGVYTIRMCPVPMLRDRLPQLRSAVFDYLATTRGDDAAESVELLHGPQGVSWTITKCHRDGQALYPFISLRGMKREGEVRIELRRLVEERLAEKQKRLGKIDSPKLLLLVDAYVLGDLDAWAEAAKDSANYGFGMVAVVGAGFGCRILAGEPTSLFAAA